MVSVILPVKPKLLEIKGSDWLQSASWNHDATNEMAASVTPENNEMHVNNPTVDEW